MAVVVQEVGWRRGRRRVVVVPSPAPLVAPEEAEAEQAAEQQHGEAADRDPHHDGRGEPRPGGRRR